MTTLSLRNINVHASETFRLTDISLELSAGELIGVIGPNGSGKSTLAKTLVGLARLESGEIKINNRSLNDISNLDRAKLLGYLPQNAAFSWDLPVGEAVKLGRFSTRPSLDNEQNLVSALTSTGVAHLSHRSVLELSGGEQMRVHIARLFYGQHDILIADEPCASLDLAYQSRVMALLRENSQNNISMVILHDINLAQSFCDKLLLLHDGNAVMYGRPRDVLGSNLAAEVFGMKFRGFDATSLHASSNSVLLPIFPPKENN